MANNLNVYQQTHTFSVPRNPFIENIVCNNDLKKKDIKVACLLLTQLNGFNSDGVAYRNNNHDSNDFEDYEPDYDNAVNRNGRKIKDPKNFKRLDYYQIAETLDMKKKEVVKIIDKLLDYGILERGSNNSVRNGYRFTF